MKKKTTRDLVISGSRRQEQANSKVAKNDLHEISTGIH